MAPPPLPTCRFAPSPNGPLHLGHAYSALRNQAVATRLGGRLLLRMENIDLARCLPAFETAAADDLAWLGLVWERPVWRQSDRFDAYAAALDRLDAAGLVYPCFCTRGEVAASIAGARDWPRDPDGSPLYPGTCRDLPASERARRLAEGRAFALRLDLAAALIATPGPIAWEEFGEGEIGRTIPADPAAWGDAVLKRKDIPASYHIAVVVDDAAQGITDVVRGRDLFDATALHRLLQRLLDLAAPRYHHHRLVLGEDGLKLSKSRGSPTLAALRRAGASPTDVVRTIVEALNGRPQ